jgi:hypothetical protein
MFFWLPAVINLALCSWCGFQQDSIRISSWFDSVSRLILKPNQPGFSMAPGRAALTLTPTFRDIVPEG